MKQKYEQNRKRSESILIKVTKDEKAAIQSFVFNTGESSVGAWIRKLAAQEINKEQR